MGDDIQIRLVEWPTLTDIDVVGDEFKAIVVNPSDTGYNSAYPNLCDLLKKRWNIEHRDEDLIGFRAREIG